MAVRTMEQLERLSADRDRNLRVGAIVRIKPEYLGRIRTKTFDRTAPLVVFADKFDMVNCVPVGGDAGGRYQRIPATWLRVIDPASVVIP